MVSLGATVAVFVPRLRARLDRGEGKDLDLEELPRERLEKEKITQVLAILRRPPGVDCLSR